MKNEQERKKTIKSFKTEHTRRNMKPQIEILTTPGTPASHSKGQHLSRQQVEKLFAFEPRRQKKEPKEAPYPFSLSSLSLSN